MKDTQLLIPVKQYGGVKAPWTLRFLARIAKALFCVGTLAFFLTADSVDRADAGQQARDDDIVSSFTNVYGPAIQQLYVSELHYLRLVTQPTRMDFEKISKAAEPSIKAATHEFATGFRDLKMRYRVTHHDSAQNMIVREVARQARDTLSPDQNRRLQKEIELRKAARKQASLQYLLVRLDSVLLLSPLQCSRMEKILNDHWDDSMSHSWPEEMLEFPQLPDAEIVVLLTDVQKTVWRGLARGRSYIDLGSMVLLRADLGTEIWEEDPSSKK